MNELVCHKCVEVSALVQRRVAWRLAEGWELGLALAAEELLVSEAGWLAEDADFLMLVDGFRRLGERSREEVVDQLVEMAWLVLEEALLAGDPRVALLFLKEEFAGRRPAEVIAEAVLGPREAGRPMTVFVPPVGIRHRCWGLVIVPHVLR